VAVPRSPDDRRHCRLIAVLSTTFARGEFIPFDPLCVDTDCGAGAFQRIRINEEEKPGGLVIRTLNCCVTF
jgi:hypothetical protein